MNNLIALAIGQNMLLRLLAWNVEIRKRENDNKKPTHSLLKILKPKVKLSISSFKK